MKKLKILLVDDETDFATTLAERMRLRGLRTEVATDGETALGMIEQDPPDVVVLDLKMPGMGGLEVLEQIKARDKSIHVILLTGHGSTREGIEGMRLGAFDYLMKPIDIDDLIGKLNDAVG